MMMIVHYWFVPTKFLGNRVSYGGGSDDEDATKPARKPTHFWLTSYSIECLVMEGLKILVAL